MPTDINKLIKDSKLPTIVASVIVSLCALVFGGLFVVNSIANQDQITTTPQTTDYAKSSFENVTGSELNLELASKAAQWQQGLMFRTKLASNSGMLFLFPKAEIRTFWMKNTFIPLDIVFLDSDFKVIDIVISASPNQTIETYTSSKPSQFVLEVNGGWSTSKNIKVGDKLIVENIPTP